MVKFPKTKLDLRTSSKETRVLLQKYYFYILGTVLVVLVCLCALIHYQYVYLASTDRSQLQVEIVSINRDFLQKVADNISERDASLQEIQSSSSPDPFNID